MTQKPVIGITSYGVNEAGDYSLPAVYVHAVRRAGGLPVLLPPDADEAEGVCERVDGILLTGGGDIDPRHYNGQQHDEIYNINEERDKGEFRVVEFVLERQIPTLAICRGIQVLTVFLGGSLHEHLPDVYGEDIIHRLPLRVACRHAVEIISGSKLAGIMSRSPVEIVSWHHQAIKDVPGDVVVTARSVDGVIEAIEMDSHPWLIGVQWHPELSAAEDPLQQKLFDTLVEQAVMRR